MEQRSTEMTALEKAALMIRQLKEKLDQYEQQQQPSVAVVGMACRFPGDINSPEQFWDGLIRGIDTVTELPADRWETDSKEKLYGSFLKDIDGFDATFFGISPREAKAMDPQQRLLMEASWQAFEDAGIKPSALRGSQTGVFIGAMSHDYAEWSYEPDVIDVYTGTGTSNSILAGRLAYYYDLHGPAMTIDTACSSSLVAIHQAVRSLRAKESKVCIVGGVNAIVSPSLYNIEIKNQMLSPDGRCKTFDASANGFARGEGVGMIVLKCLEDAIADNDRIYCIIRGSAVNHDGRSTGLMAPSQAAQELLLHTALKDAKLTADKIDFVECHGTGTTLGDPVEVGALQEVYGKARKSSLYLGAVKSNMGHLEGAAGIAGFMKLALSVYYGAMPPNVHFNKPNPYIDWTKQIEIPKSLVKWQTEERTGGVSSFGFSGTNAHIIVSSYKQVAPEGSADSYMPLAFSAASEEALKQCIKGFDYVNAAAAHTLSCRREQLSYRKLFFGTIQQENISAVPAQWIKSKPSIVFLFSGQGSQEKDMGRFLYEHHPVFKQKLDECNTVYISITGNDLLSYVYSADADVLNDTSITQPALFAISYAAAFVWRAHGIEPDVLVGHSIGEWAAACFGGMLSLEDAMRLVIERGRLMQHTEEGVMYAVNATVDTLKRFTLHYTFDIAGVNAPDQTVISGKVDDLERLAERLKTEGIKARRLNVKRAFHSTLMNGAAIKFGQYVNSVSFTASEYPIYNNIDGELLTPERIKMGYWQQQILSPVNFMQVVKKLPNDAVLIETGHGNTLLNLASRINTNLHQGFAGASTSANNKAFYNSLISLYEKGLLIDFRPFFTERHLPVSLLPYQFQREKYWIKDEVNMHLRRSNKSYNILPGRYRREWVDVNVDSYAGMTSNVEVECFIVEYENILAATVNILLDFSSLLNNYIKSGKTRIVIDVNLIKAANIYRKALTMSLLACWQSVVLEHPGIFSGLLFRYDASDISSDLMQSLFAQRGAFLVDQNNIKKLVWSEETYSIAPALTVKDDKAYIITGGSGSVGLVLAKYAAEKGAGHIFLLGRKPYEMLSSEHKDILSNKGPGIEYIQTSELSKDTILELVRSSGKNLGGIFHAAGSYSNLAVQDYSLEKVSSVVEPKVQGTLVLLEACKEMNADFLLTCSSASTMTGAPMLGHYTFANAFMDGLIEQETAIQCHSIAWGGWKGSNMLGNENNEAFQKQWGFAASSAASMLRTFEHLQTGYTAVVNINWKQFFIAAPEAAIYQPFISFASPSALMSNTVVPSNKKWVRREIYDEVYKTVAAILQTTSKDIDTHKPFDELGFNSLLVLELSNALNEIFKLQLSATITYAYTTPESLAAHIADTLIPKSIGLPITPQVSKEPVKDVDTENLSLDDITALLSKKLNA